VLTIDFDQPREEGGVWNLRQYCFGEGTLSYTLGFNSRKLDAMAGLFERMARSFEFLED
jgi:hypothetical protein